MRQLDLVLPCYNPVPDWAETVVQHITNLGEILSDTEIFLCLVNDGSTQGIKQADIDLLEKSFKNFTYLFYATNQGKGYALRKGVEQAQHDICMYTDVDFPYQTESFVQVYKALYAGENDIVVGVRDENYYLEMKGNRAPLSKILKFLNQKLFRLPINDTQCGIKGFNQKGRQVFLQTITNRYLFDLEFVFLAAKDASIKFKAVPVILRAGITFRKFDLRILVTESTSFMRILLKAYSRSGA